MKATKQQRKILREYVRWMANALELRDWTFTVDRQNPDDADAIASIKCTYGRKWAVLRCCNDFLDMSLEKQRQAICHELLHCHTSGIEWQFNNLGSHVQPSTFDIVWGGIKDQIEFATDAMADAVAKHLPLPKQAKGKTP